MDNNVFTRMPENILRDFAERGVDGAKSELKRRGIALNTTRVQSEIKISRLDSYIDTIKEKTHIEECTPQLTLNKTSLDFVNKRQLYSHQMTEKSKIQTASPIIIDRDAHLVALEKKGQHNNHNSEINEYDKVISPAEWAPDNDDLQKVLSTNLSTVMLERKIFRLRDITNLIKSSLLSLTTQKFWVKAHLHVNPAGLKGGNFYCNLVDVDDRGIHTAKIRGTIWNESYNKICRKLKDAGYPNALQDNSEICVLCSVRFHDIYGLSLDIADVDPAFSEAQINRNRRIIIEKLTTEGILKKNAGTKLPMAALKIGLISSRDSAAYKDFTKTIFGSSFSFKVIFAEASMQGEKTEADVINAIGLLEKFGVDVICIIRGGGSQDDLAWFDNEKIARRIIICSIPIWVGIGHEIDVGVLDVIAHTAHKTPTAAAEALVNHLQALSIGADIAFDRLKNITERAIALLESSLQSNIQGTSNELRKYFTLLEGNIKNSTIQTELRFIRRFKDKEHSVNMKGIRIRDALFSIAKNGEKDICNYVSNLQSGVEYFNQSKRKIITDRTDKMIPLIGRNLRNHEVALMRNVDGSYNGFRKYYSFVFERFEKNISRTDIRFVKCFTDRVNNLGQKVISLQKASLQIIMDNAKFINDRGKLLRSSCFYYEQKAQKVIGEETTRLNSVYYRSIYSKEQSFSVKMNRLQLSRYMGTTFEKEKSLTDKTRRLNSLKPENVLKRGYSVTRDISGKVINRVNQIEEGQVIVTQYGEGYSESIIKKRRIN